METQATYHTKKTNSTDDNLHFMYTSWFQIHIQQPLLQVERIHSDAILPQYVHDGDSGMDVYSAEDVIIPPGEARLINTGLKMSVPHGYEIQVRPKSGIAMKCSVTVLNAPGTIDRNYRGEVGVILINHGRNHYCVQSQRKIAQLVVCPVVCVKIEEVNVLDTTTRGEGGFGSTGLSQGDSNAVP